MEGCDPLKVAPLPRETRQARAFLVGRGLGPSDLSPADFAGASKELGKGFGDTLKLVAALAMGGQGCGPAPIAEAIAKRGRG